MRALPLVLSVLPIAMLGAQTKSFGICKPVLERSTEVGCWILTDAQVGRAKRSDVYWHLDTYPDSEQALRAKGPHGAVIRALGHTWLMTIDAAGWRAKAPATHVADIGPLRVKRGTSYSATFMEAISEPGTKSAVHRHSGPEAWYTVAGETCLETPMGKRLGQPQHPVIVPQGPPMLLTTTGTSQRRAITLILHDASKPTTTIEKQWKPRGLCK